MSYYATKDPPRASPEIMHALRPAPPALQRMNRTHREWIGWLLAAGLAWTVFGLALAPPFAGEGLRHAIMSGFSGACHQMPARSPHVHGVPLAVCDRCFGVYAALAAAPFLALGMRPWNAWMQRHAKYLLLASLIVPGVDWFGDGIGWWVNTPWSRGLTGAAFGTGAGYFMATAMMSLTRRPDDGREGGGTDGEKLAGASGPDPPAP